MRISQNFTVARPLGEVWAFFQDVPAVARCMPGAELTDDQGDGRYAGKVKARLGPFGANFEGEAKVTANPADHSGHVEGKGVDRRGGSRTRMVMDYRLAAVEEGTEVTVDADVTLAGAIAQFGRTGLLQETATILVRDFAGALEGQLAAPAAGPAAGPTAPVAPQGAGPPPAADSAPMEAPVATAGPPSTGDPPSENEPPSSAQGPLEAPAGPTATDATAAPSAAPQPRPEAPAPPRAVRAGSVGLRALWAWLKSLVRGLFSGSNGKSR